MYTYKHGEPKIHSTQNYSHKIRKKLLDWRKTTHNWRIMGSVWVLYLLSAHIRPIYPTHFAGSPYTARITATITPI